MRRFCDANNCGRYLTIAAWVAGVAAFGGLPSRSGAESFKRPVAQAASPQAASPRQEREQERGASFSTRTELVQVPVVVTDRHGNPIRDLTRDDFVVEEDGKPRKLAVFEQVIAPPPGFSAPPAADEFTNLPGKDVPRRNITIIVLDSLNTPFFDQARSRQELVKYLAKQVDREQLVGLMTISRKGIKIIHDFTTDTRVLVAALKKVAGELQPATSADDPTSDAGNYIGGQDSAAVAQEAASLSSFAIGKDAADEFIQDNATRNTLQAFQQIAQAVAGMPGRKALIWATGSMPPPFENSRAEIRDSYERTFQLLNNANVSVYPVDARGLVAIMPGAARMGGFGATPRMGGRPRDPYSVQSSSIETLRDFAQMTGGKAFVNTNDLSGAFRKAFLDSEAYYQLGYYLDRGDKPGWHKLKVKVNRPGTQVRARNGFFVTEPESDPQKALKNDLNLAVRSPMDYTAIPLKVKWLARTPRAEKTAIRFSIALAPGALTIEEADNNHLHFEVVAVARNPQGEVAGSVSQTVEGNLKPATLGVVKERGFTYAGEVLLPRGEYTVRLVVRDDLAGKIGSVSAPLKVE